jgi:CHAT domain
VDLTAVAERAARRHAAGMAASDGGRPAVAVRHLRAGLRLLDRAGGGGALAEVRGRLLVSLAWAEFERGRVDLGFQLLDQAEPGIPDGQLPLLLAQRALLLRRSGHNEAALPWLDRAIALFESWPDKLYLVKALNNRSMIHLDAGRVRPARADLRRCGQIAARHGLDLHVVLSRVNLGCLDVLAGNLPAALGAFAAARPEYERLAPGRLSGLAVERARALVAAGLFGPADRELTEAMEHAARQRLSHLYADALLVRAEAALLAGRPVAAAHWAGQARAQFLGRNNARRAALAALLELRASSTVDSESLGDGTDPAVARGAEAMAARLSRLGLPEDARVAALVAARAWLREGRPSRAELVAARYGPPGRVDRLDTRLLWRLTLAELATAAGRPAEASRQLLAGMTTLHRHRSQFGCLDLQTGAAVHGRDLARAGLAAAVASGRSGTVYRWAERARAQALLLPPVRPPRDPEAAAALEELRQSRHALHDAELTGRPTGTLRGRVAALQRTVRERTWSTPGRRGAAGAGTTPLSTIRAELGATALVMYLRDGAALRALTVVDGTAELVALGAHADAEEAVLRLRADLDARAGRALPGRLAAAVAGATAHDARALAAAVLDPLLDRVGDRDLVVVPTGLLVTVPWSMLPGCAGRPVTVAPSATAWHAAWRRLASGPPDAGTLPGAGALLVAGPGNARGEAEVRAIAGLRPQSTVLSGPSATPSATLEALGTATVAHLAAHGHHQAENALFSALDLAGGPLLGYDLPGAGRTPPMVVLSSCDLGLSDVRPGDETFGMATALLAAGTATVVASVARVADDAAMAVMVRYHRGIVTGRSPAAALAAALEPDPAAAFICLGAG